MRHGDNILLYTLDIANLLLVRQLFIDGGYVFGVAHCQRLNVQLEVSLVIAHAEVIFQEPFKYLVLIGIATFVEIASDFAIQAAEKLLFQLIDGD